MTRHTLGVLLKEKRERLSLTQMEVAKSLGYTSPQYVSNWERGTCYPAIDSLGQLAKVLKIREAVLAKLMIKLIAEEIVKEMKFSCVVKVKVRAT